MRNETLERLISEYTGEPGKLAAYITSLLEDEAKIKERVWRVHHMEYYEIERHGKEMTKIREERSAIQNDCSHHETKFYPDPAGGNASSTDCVLCGKSL